MGDEPSMPDRPRRRSFNADYKMKILVEYDGCAGDGDKGAPLRWEACTRAKWSSGHEPGTPVRSPGSGRKSARTRKCAERAEAELAKTRLVVKIQGKASELSGC